ARRWLWAWAIFSAWPVVAVGAAIWTANDRSWTSFGFSVPEGWRLWTSLALFSLLAAYFVYTVAALALSAEAWASVRRQFGKLTDILPRTRTEMLWFGGVSLTAGFCEEFLFRGYFIWALAPWLGWWGAAAASVLTFGFWHLYQGWNGALRTGIVGALFTLTVAIFGSLWPAIALHALLDLGQGLIAWLALRDGDSTGDATGIDKPTYPPPPSSVESSPAPAEPPAAPNPRDK
ncbi:MAG TPA: type II CAAX endopeptidase family protein, partial [Planctomycetia bacterium]|nr:type II CAAX endopeptidase family protein [Planctomycetia bacterium]